MKKSKVSRFFQIIIITFCLFFSLLFIDRFTRKGSFVRIVSPVNPQEIYIDGHKYPSETIVVFLPPGNHRLELQFKWHVPLHIQFTSYINWHIFEPEPIINCSPISIEPNYIMEQSLYDFAVNNSPIFELPILFERAHELELAARVLHNQKKTWSIRTLQESWLSHAWAVSKNSDARKHVISAASILVTGWDNSIMAFPMIIHSIIQTSASFDVPLHSPLQFQPVVIQSEWAKFLRACPQWSARQIPALKKQAIVDNNYLRDFEIRSDSAQINSSIPMKDQPIYQVSYPAIIAYIEWKSKTTGQRYRLPDAKELIQVPSALRTDLEWTSSRWPDVLNLLSTSPKWKFPYRIAMRSRPNGTFDKLIIPHQACLDGMAFRLVLSN